MKKLISIFLTAIMLFSTAMTSFAVDYADSEIAYFADGSYVEIEIKSYDVRASVYATKTKTADKKITYRNSDNELIFDATVTGTFTYTGSSATCTNSTISYNVYDSKWKITEATASKSGNKAIGDITAKRYLLGIPVQTVEQTITLTCSAAGVLS